MLDASASHLGYRRTTVTNHIRRTDFGQHVLPYVFLNSLTPIYVPIFARSSRYRKSSPNSGQRYNPIRLIYCASLSTFLSAMLTSLKDLAGSGAMPYQRTMRRSSGSREGFSNFMNSRILYRVRVEVLCRKKLPDVIRASSNTYSTLFRPLFINIS